MRAPSQRQDHPRHRPAMLRPELDTLGEALSTWPWVLCGPMFHRPRWRHGPWPGLSGWGLRRFLAGLPELEGLPRTEVRTGP
jgi:hypothetical protein